MEEVYDAIIKLPVPLGKKECKVALTRKEDGSFDGEFTVLDATAPITNGKIDADGNFSGACSITTIMGTMDAATEGKITDGKIEGAAKCRLGTMPYKSAELW
jgi:hypothetical protein